MHSHLTFTRLALSVDETRFTASDGCWFDWNDRVRRVVRDSGGWRGGELERCLHALGVTSDTASVPVVTL